MYWGVIEPYLTTSNKEAVRNRLRCELTDSIKSGASSMKKSMVRKDTGTIKNYKLRFFEQQELTTSFSERADMDWVDIGKTYLANHGITMEALAAQALTADDL